ncbi:MAG: hypothetical protein OXG61_08515 [Chloroflexi bacterium]|nr:hypothetical protein [Chloroflexota bacterium]
MDGVIVAATVVIASSALASLWLNWRLSQDNRALRKAGTEPEVVAYLAPDPRSGFFLDLVLENVGQGPACDVEYFVDAEPVDFAKHEVKYVPARTARKIKSLLPQGQRVSRFIGVGNRLYSEDEEARLQPFRVTVWYSTLRGTRIGPKEYVIDVAELGGSAQVDPGEERIAQSLEKIEKHLDHFASGFQRLHVETMTTAERRQQDQERRARWEQEAAAAEAADEQAS